MLTLALSGVVAEALPLLRPRILVLPASLLGAGCRRCYCCALLLLPAAAARQTPCPPAAAGGPYVLRFFNWLKQVSPASGQQADHTLRSPAFGGSTSGSGLPAWVCRPLFAAFVSQSGRHSGCYCCNQPVLRGCAALMPMFGFVRPCRHLHCVCERHGAGGCGPRCCGGKCAARMHTKQGPCGLHVWAHIVSPLVDLSDTAMRHRSLP